MDLRQILLLVDASEACAARVRAAAALAKVHGATLAGVWATGRIELPSGLGAATWALESAEGAREAMLQAADAGLEGFRRQARSLGVAACCEDITVGDRSDVLLHHTPCSDLVVVTRPAPRAPDAAADLSLLEKVLSHNPRPTLVLPPGGHHDALGRCVLVAWDGSAACVRAVTDALPVLRKAPEVHLRAWRRPRDPVAEAITARLRDVAAWLQRHDVAARCDVAVAPGAVGDSLMRDAAGLGADLIVMGTYGHARWIERITGGVTRSALAHSRVPLWMSH